MTSAFAPIFVFGSNMAGRHGKGAALFAKRNYGAKQGVGEGRTGNAYAIPTKYQVSDTDTRLLVLPLDRIADSVARFIRYALDYPELEFHVTAIGTGLAGYSHYQIAPMFAGAPPNCKIPEPWLKSFKDTKT